MSADSLQNLPYSINLRESTVLSVDVMKTANKTLNKYYFEAHYEDYLSFYKQYKSLFGVGKHFAAMQSEKVILCEINAGLWVKAIKSAISSLTGQAYPHYFIVQEFINYLFNADTDENFGLLESFFWQLLLFHPPTPEMFDYYSQIMLSHFVVLHNKATEKHNLFVCLMEAYLNILQIIVNSNGNDEWNPDFINENDDSGAECSEQERRIVRKNLSFIENNHPKAKVKTHRINFRDLQWHRKIKRCLIVLNFVYNILEADFVFWLNSKNWKPFLVSREIRGAPRLLLSHILWPDARDIGLINKEVHRVLGLYKLLIKSNLSYQYKNIIEKYVILIGEVIRSVDSMEGTKYPFVGTKSENFFRELSIILHEVFSKEFPGGVALNCHELYNTAAPKLSVLIEMSQRTNLPKDGLLVNFKPSWLRLFLCSHLLSSITGSQCQPELTTAYDILMQILHNENRSSDIIKAQENPRNTKHSKTIQKLKKIKSINAKLATGKTHLHTACEENDIEKIKALLTLPELDVNVTDREGWTALHRAAYTGNVTTVKELLLFAPRWGILQKSVNTRARGPQSITPIMCAALKSHTDVCEILLEHSGSILIEDTNEFNQTALELASTPEVKKILEYYKKNNVSTFHSHKDMDFNSDMKQLVLRLCTEMIQAYFCTHRTWDVYRTFKRSLKNSSEEFSVSDMEYKWDYMRYHRDIKRNIYKLRTLVPELKNMEEFKGLHEVYVRLLSLNKVC